MKVALLRVGIDSGCGGMQGPLFANGTFEYLPIPDGSNTDKRTYGNLLGRHNRRLVEYFPPSRQEKMANQPVHLDPEFTTFTYGDPTPLKAGLRHLERGDLLVFYCGLAGWGECTAPPALYLLGYFDVLTAGRASEYTGDELHRLFKSNFHVRHRRVLEQQRDRLVLVKGSDRSRMFTRAVCISEMGRNCRGRPLKVLSRPMQAVFGDFGGKISIERSPTRWVAPEYTDRAASFVKGIY